MSDAFHRFPGSRAAVAAACDCDPVVAAAEAWRCACPPGYSKAEAARCLLAQTIEALCDGRHGDDLRFPFIGPMSAVVASQKSAQGQALCATYFAAMCAGDHAAALDACQQLVELDDFGETGGWGNPSGAI